MLSAAGALIAAQAQRTRGGVPPLHDSAGVLLVTLDPRSPLPAQLGVFRRPGEPVAVTGELDLLHLDPLAAVESAWHDFTAALLTVAGGRHPLPLVGTLASVAPGEMTALPGAQEFLLLRRIRDAATSGRWDRIVVDLSGVGDPFALLRAPTLLATTVERLWPRHRRLAQASEQPALAQLAGAVESIGRDCDDLRELLADPSAVAAHLVLDGGERGRRQCPDQLAIAELLGLPLRSVLVNPGAGGLDPQPVLECAAELLSGAPAQPQIAAVPHVDGPLDRLSRLRRLTVDLPGPDGRAHGSGALEVVHRGGSGLEAVYELSWRQGLPEPDRLVLGRSGDDLLVTVSGFRHPVRLPSVLRRCTVAGAQWAHGRLTVEFTPDPAVWPQRAGRR